jgi:pyruvate dehydrogenase E2 component (dihydrolipoamide acetyltransferase)
MADLSQLARNGKLSGEQMRGGCFTISSLGGIGGGHFTPIINAPEVAILGVGKAVMQPSWDGSAFQPRLQLPLSLSWDHRAVDGAEAGRFLACLATLLADFRRVSI